MKDILRQFSVIFTVILTIVMNTLAVILPLNGQDTGAISDSFKVYFVPAGYVFSIWGIIYIGLITFAVYQALPSKREDPAQRAVGWWFSLGGIANSLWIVLWHYLQFPLTVPVMFVLLSCLILSYIGLGINKRPVSVAEKWLVHVPTSIYLGWITVATVANVTVLLEFLQWDRFGLDALTWLGIILFTVCVIAGIVNFTRRDIAFAAVLLWALAGIAVKHSTISFVVNAAWLSFGWVIVTYLLSVLISKRKRI